MSTLINKYFEKIIKKNKALENIMKMFGNSSFYKNSKSSENSKYILNSLNYK
jgi:hypothetical protein